MTRTAAVAAVALLAAGCAAAPRLVDADRGSGFALYRSGRLDAAALGRLCREGVEEMVVLDGTAAGRECRWRDALCPGLAIRYDLQQRASVPVERGFLAAFDAWVEEARREGRKIAFRCRHGWHRAGRLAAYYRLRFEGASAAAATEEMNRLGRFMWKYRYLERQVDAYADHLAGRPCSADPEQCVREGGSAADAGAAEAFAADVCPPPPLTPAASAAGRGTGGGR